MVGYRPMPLETGARLGPHEIIGLLGAGGMGEERQSSVLSRQSSIPTDDFGLVTEDWRVTTTSPCR